MIRNLGPTSGFQPPLNPTIKPVPGVGPQPGMFRIAPRLKENQLNGNNPGGNGQRCHNKNGDGTLTAGLKRNLPHPEDVHLSVGGEDYVIRHGQANYKMKKHGHDFDLPYYENASGRKITPPNPENLQKFKEVIETATLNGKRVDGTLKYDREVIHFFNKETRRDVMYDVQTKDFISGWRLTPEQIDDLNINQNVGRREL